MSDAAGRRVRELPDGIDFKSELSCVPDEGEPAHVFAIVASLLSLGPCRRKQEADLLVIADRLHLHASPRDNSPIARSILTPPLDPLVARGCSLSGKWVRIACMSMSEGLRFRVEGMDCAYCAARIDAALRRTPGVSRVNVSVSAGTVVVDHDGSAEAAMLARTMGALGYKATRQKDGVDGAEGHQHHHRHDHADEPHSHGHDHADDDGPLWKSPRGLLTIACGAALVVAFVIGQLVPSLSPWAFLGDGGRPCSDRPARRCRRAVRDALLDRDASDRSRRRGRDHRRDGRGGNSRLPLSRRRTS